jgi:SAM-dependent methyltransferase
MRSVSRRFRQRIERPFKVAEQGHLKKFRLFVPFVQGKIGLEIGGPSDVFRPGNALPVYEEALRIDNCDFSGATVWTQHSSTFVFNAQKDPGKTIVSEGSALREVADSTYDFVLSSHNLEHFANPVKALKEWQRVLKPGGALILALPYYKDIFDHRRKPTAVRHMLQDFSSGTAESDLTHLPEILEKHDLSMDLAAGTREEFHRRSLDNFSNRCLHHHVFDKQNSRELLTAVGFQVLAIDTVISPHILILAHWTKS